MPFQVKRQSQFNNHSTKNDIHHKDSFLNYTGDKHIEVAFNPDNLLAVCKQCLHKNGTTHGHYPNVGSSN